jgi:hypothetical protein
MTKQLTTSDIIAQKLEHINYFRDDGLHDALFIGMSRDACYTANNSLTYKRNQLAEVLEEYDRHVKNGNDYAAERSEQFGGRIHAEVTVLEERLDIEKAVYFMITDGEEWIPNAKRPVKRKSSVGIDAMRAKVA